MANYVYITLYIQHCPSSNRGSNTQGDTETNPVLHHFPYDWFLLGNVQFQKISILPHRRDWNFLGVGSSVRPKNLKKCMKLNWNFQRGGWGEVLEKNPFHGGGMSIFWNYTIDNTKTGLEEKSLIKASCKVK